MSLCYGQKGMGEQERRCVELGVTAGETAFMKGANMRGKTGPPPEDPVDTSADPDRSPEFERQLAEAEVDLSAETEALPVASAPVEPSTTPPPAVSPAAPHRARQQPTLVAVDGGPSEPSHDDVHAEQLADEEDGEADLDDDYDAAPDGAETLADA